MANKIVLDMPAPNEKQDMALRDTHRYVAYGGARGGGKSWFVRWKAILLALNFAGIKILITRKTFRELLNNHITPLLVTLNGIARYNKSDKCFTFPNGSTIWFGYCACDGDLGQYQGAEYDVWFADEAGQFLESWLTAIDACVRGVNGFPKRTYYTLNPGGPSHGYFKRLFVDGRFNGDEHPEDYSFIQARCTDNTALMASQPEYMRSLEKLPPKIREAWLYGRWDIYEGQFFEDFREEPDGELCAKAGITREEAKAQGRFTHVIAPLDLNAGSRRGWTIYRSYDFGYAKPFSCAWWAIDYDGVMYRILELHIDGIPHPGHNKQNQNFYIHHIMNEPKSLHNHHLLLFIIQKQAKKSSTSRRSHAYSYGKGVMPLKHILMYPIGSTDACGFAAAYLKQTGVSLTDHPSPEVTHLLLDIPSFSPISLCVSSCSSESP